MVVVVLVALTEVVVEENEVVDIVVVVVVTVVLDFELPVVDVADVAVREVAVVVLPQFSKSPTENLLATLFRAATVASHLVRLYKNRPKTH